MERTRELPRQNTPGGTQPDILVPRDDDTDDTDFEVDPITHVRLSRSPLNTATYLTQLSAFTDSVPDDHAPEVLLAYAQRTTAPPLPEQSPDLVSCVVAMDDATFTTLLSLSSEASASSRFNCRALLDTGSPPSFIHQGAFDQMVATGAADASYVRVTTLKSWSGFSSQQMLSTLRQTRMTVQFHHDGAPSASLAVWMYLVPDETMRCRILL